MSSETTFIQTNFIKQEYVLNRLIKCQVIWNNSWRLCQQDLNIFMVIDETFDITWIVLLAIFFRACDNEFNSFEELIEVVPLHGTTSSLDTFKKIK